MSKQPVTELYEAAEHIHAPGRPGHARLDKALAAFEHEDRATKIGLLDVLDLVATLPPERLGLMRWVAGLSVEQLGEVQGLLEMGTAEAKKRGYPDWEKGVAYGAEFMRAALSGGEGGAKEEAPRKKTSTAVVAELLKRGDMEAAEARGEALGWRARANRLGEENERLRSALGDIRVYLAGSNPQRDLLALGVVIKAFDSGGTKEAHPACTGSGCKSCGFSGGCDQGEEEQPPHPMWGAVARAVVKTTPTILPAGKPPPFLRVGMVLVDPRGHGTLTLWSLDMALDTWLCRGSRDGVFERERASVLLTWLLAEPFTVEGEKPSASVDVGGQTCEPMSPPMVEGRKRCTCNTSPNPRRCEGQSKLGEDSYCVEGKP